jgi:hypothetical protein
MCIRALDYCPPVDLTFGEFLRALITADMDLLPGDSLGYRVAFIESFRRHGIYPEKVRTMSEDSLRWRRIDEQDVTKGDQDALRPLIEGILSKVEALRRSSPARPGYREEVWQIARSAREELHDMVEMGIQKARVLERLTGLVLSPESREDLPPGVRVNREGKPSFEIRAFYESRREGEDGRILNQVFITLAQRRKVRVDGDSFTLQCGSTLVADLDEQRVVYVIRTGLNSENRIGRTADFRRRLAGSGLAETYFRGGAEPLAALHRHF